MLDDRSVAQMEPNANEKARQEKKRLVYNYVSHRFDPFTVTLLPFFHFCSIVYDRNNIVDLKRAHFLQRCRMECPSIRAAFVLYSVIHSKSLLLFDSGGEQIEFIDTHLTSPLSVIR